MTQQDDAALRALAESIEGDNEEYGATELTPHLAALLPDGVQPLPLFVYKALTSIVFAYAIKPATFHFSALSEHLKGGTLTLPVMIKVIDGVIEALFDSHSRRVNAQRLTDAVSFCANGACIVVHLQVMHYNPFSLSRLLSDMITLWQRRIKDGWVSRSQSGEAPVHHQFWYSASRCLALSYRQLNAVSAVTQHDYRRSAVRTLLESCSYGRGYVSMLLADTSAVHIDMAQADGVRSFGRAAFVVCSVRSSLENGTHHAALAASCGVTLGVSPDTVLCLNALSLEDTLNTIVSGAPLRMATQGQAERVILRIEWTRAADEFYSSNEMRAASKSSSHAAENEASIEQSIAISGRLSSYLSRGPLAPLLRFAQQSGVSGVLATQSAPQRVVCSVLPGIGARRIIEEVLSETYYENNPVHTLSGSDYFVAIHCLAALGFTRRGVLSGLERVACVRLLSYGQITLDNAHGFFELESYLRGLKFALPHLLLSVLPTTQKALSEWCIRMMGLSNLRITGSDSDSSPLLDEPDMPAAQYMEEPSSPPEAPMEGVAPR